MDRKEQVAEKGAVTLKKGYGYANAENKKA